jgi:hypothetical protein
MNTKSNISDELIIRVDKFLQPKTWRRSLRRAFVLTLPISWPLWAIFVSLLVLIGVLIGVSKPAANWIRRMWK